MAKHATIDVHTEHSHEPGDDPAWVRYRWMCSKCGHTDLADTSVDARAAGDQHVAEEHAEGTIS